MSRRRANERIRRRAQAPIPAGPAFMALMSRAANHGAVCVGRDFLHVFRSGYAESHRNGQVGVPPHHPDKIAHPGRHLGAGAGHAEHRHAVDKSTGAAAGRLHAPLGRGERDQGNNAHPGSRGRIGSAVPASSAGRSAAMSPFTPADADMRQYRSMPRDNTGL